MTRRGAITCDRCGQRSGRRGHGDWIVTAFAGWVVAYVCPACQTAEENAEAVANEALLAYRRDRDGRVLTSPRVTT